MPPGAVALLRRQSGWRNVQPDRPCCFRRRPGRSADSIRIWVHAARLPARAFSVHCGMPITASAPVSWFNWPKTKGWVGGVLMHLARVLPWQRFAVAGLVAIFALTAIGHEEVLARPHKGEKHKRVVHGPNYHPPYAAIVIDDKTGQVLHETNPDAPRHPASLTKIMTLYLLFEQIEAGRFKLNNQLDVSMHAAVQNPTKLGLKPGGKITVEDAIKGMVTRSANDAAVVVAGA